MTELSSIATLDENRQRASAALDVDILSLATAVPEHAMDQDAALDMALAYIPDFKSSASIFRNTGIETRYSCVPLAWHHEKNGWMERADVFRREASKLLATVAKRAIADAGIERDDIGAIVTISTTGVVVPGLDVIIANQLDLPPTVERLPIFGLGCAGGVSGLARAARIAQTMPDKAVLVLAVELCTINCRNGDRSMANFVSTALFADGAAGLIIQSGAAPGNGNRAPLATIRAAGELMWRTSEHVMGWSVEKDGFGVVISSDIPRYARERLRPAADDFLARLGATVGDLDGVVFHPGGKKVIEAIESALDLAPDAMRHSRSVLSDYGNMSSPTALFVLERTLAEGTAKGASGARGTGAKGQYLLGAFGPGFTVAMALLDIPARA